MYALHEQHNKEPQVKINSTNETVVERDGLASDGAYGIIFNAKMAKILSDGLYSDKIQSIIRELSCNAVDSHVEVGKAGVPIQVHLPTMFEPFFHVRDFGIGMNHQEVISTFTTYGASTKIHSNELIGQLGLGCKSPFSYVDAFDVTAIKNGIERQYSMYKNESGMPSVALLGEKPTSEPNGVTVKMPVKQDDMRRFAEKAAMVFRWFSVRPEITGVNKLEISEPKIAFEGNGWRILRKNDDYYSREQNRPVALMGRVAYPLDRNSINGLSKAQTAILETPLVVDFGIGDLEIAASREALGYDERTQKSIVARLDVVLNELGQVFEKQMAGAATEWEARKIFSNIFGNDSGFRWEFEKAFGNHGLKWKNQLIKEAHVTLKTQDIWDATAGKSPDVYANNAHYKRVRQQTCHADLTIRCSDRARFIFNDLDKGALSRVNYLIETSAASAEIYFFDLTTAKKTQDDVVKILGNPSFEMASALPKRPSAARTKISMMSYRGVGSNTKAWKPVDVTLEDGGIYVLLDHWDVRGPDGGLGHGNKLERTVALAKSLGILKETDTIYAPRGAFKKKVEDSADWRDVWSVVRDEVTKRLKPSVMQTVADSAHFNEVASSARDRGLWTNNWRLDRSNGPLGRFAVAMRQLSAANDKAVKDQQLIELAKIFGNTVQTVLPSVNAKDLYGEVTAAYPMLDIVLDRSHYGYGSRFDAPALTRKVQDYINQCDRLAALELETAIKEVISA
jgi:hypothetical protein